MGRLLIQLINTQNIDTLLVTRKSFKKQEKINYLSSGRAGSGVCCVLLWISRTKYYPKKHGGDIQRTHSDFISLDKLSEIVIPQKKEGGVCG